MIFGMSTDFNVRPGKTQADAFDESFKQVMAAEKLGMDAVWLGEHHFSPDRSVLASPLIIASAIGARTERVRIGLAVQVLPLTNPLRVAEEAATVDHISKGRLDFGIGRSGLTIYYEGYNVPYSESRGRFLEALEVVTKAWTQSTFSFEGEFYSYNDVTLVPSPYQDPHPPIRVAVSSEDTYKMLGNMGYPVFIGANSPIEDLKTRLKTYRDAWQESGHAGEANCFIRVPAYVAETEEQAHSEPEESAMWMIRYGARQLAGSAASAESAARLTAIANQSYEEILARRVMFGTPEQVIDRLNMYRDELGISGVVLETNYGGQIPYELVVKSLKLLAEEVMPSFK